MLPDMSSEFDPKLHGKSGPNRPDETGGDFLERMKQGLGEIRVKAEMLGLGGGGGNDLEDTINDLIKNGKLKEAQMLLLGSIMMGKGGAGTGELPMNPEMIEETGRMSWRISELEMTIYNERNPAVLIQTIKDAMDVLDGVPDITEVGNTQLIMEAVLNPRPSNFGKDDYGLLHAVQGRLVKAAKDIRVRARKSGLKVEAIDIQDMEDEKRVEAAKRLGIDDSDVVYPSNRQRIDEEVVRINRREVKYRDPLIWKFIKGRKAKVEELARESGKSEEEIYEANPKLRDPEIDLLQNGLLAELSARRDFHEAWVQRTMTTGSTDIKDGASGWFVRPEHIDLKGYDWYMLFKNEAETEHIDEAMRAMVDVAVGTERKWVASKTETRHVITPGDYLELDIGDVLFARRQIKNPGLSKLHDFRDTEPGMSGKSEGELKKELISRIGNLKSHNPKDPKIDEHNKLLNLCWENPYPNTFSNSETFEVWFEYVLDRAKGDASAVFRAWRLFQLWEIVSRDGISAIDTPKGPAIGDPPMASDLAAWHYNILKKRHKESGVLPPGSSKKSIRTSGSMYPAGPYITLEWFDAIGKPFLDYSMVDVVDESREVSLWELWYERGLSLGALPWMKTEAPKDWVADEVSPHSFNGWLYQRFNAETVRGWVIRMAVSVNDLLGLDDSGRVNYEKMTKAFDKTFGGEVVADAKIREENRKKGKTVYEPFKAKEFGEYVVSLTKITAAKERATNPSEKERLESQEKDIRKRIFGVDPRAKVVVGWITQRHPDGSDITPGDINRPLPFASRFSSGGSFVFHDLEMSKRATDSVDTLLFILIECGFVSKETAKEIVRYCKLDNPKSTVNYKANSNILDRVDKMWKN